MADVISLKLLIDKEKNRVIYAESDEDFVDILLSFLTVPLGTITRLTSNQSLKLKMGSMNNLYKSVESIDAQYFQTPGRKAMLLSPRNGAEPHCKKLKLTIDLNAEATKYYCCASYRCYKMISYYDDAICTCGMPMNSKKKLLETASQVHRGLFVKRLTRFIISDDLQVMPVSMAASFSLFSKHGLADGSTVEETVFNISGADEILNLFVRSLVSRMPLTETFLKHEQLSELNSTIHYQGGPFIGSRTNEDMAPAEEKKITLKLMVSKSKRVVCCAEAGRDFVNLLFSFLAVPIGYMVENTSGTGSLNGCIDKLYKSVQDLDEQLFNSNVHREILVSPRLAFGFGYKHDLLEVEEASHPPSYDFYDRDTLTLTNNAFGSLHSLKIIDPKSQQKDGDEKDGGFLTRPAMFIVTDSLIVKPISSIFSVSILNELKVPFSDIEEKVVRVGKKEALRLLLYSFVSESALTNVFIREPKQEPI